MTRLGPLSVDDAHARALKKFARAHGITTLDALRLAIWAYVLPMAPSLKPPVEPLPVPKIPEWWK